MDPPKSKKKTLITHGIATYAMYTHLNVMLIWYKKISRYKSSKTFFTCKISQKIIIL